jgi:hypothetical protein
MSDTCSRQTEIFISRSGKDRTIALVIDEILRTNGFRTFMQDRDFGHSSFMERMAEGFRIVDTGGIIIALLSSNYLESSYCLKEARYPLIDDPNNKRERLIVFKLEECRPVDFLKDIIFVDLSDCIHNPQALEIAVLEAVERSIYASVADEGTVRLRKDSEHPKIEQLILFLENEDHVEHGKAAITLVVLAIAIGILLMLFESILPLWNWAFGTQYYPLFDSGFVIMMWCFALIAVCYGLRKQVLDMAKAIDNVRLSPSQLRLFRDRVAAKSWRTKWLIDAAVSEAIRKTTAF